MDDSASADLIDVSPIACPDHFQITTKQPLWRGEEPQIDDGIDYIFDIADNSGYHHESAQRLPRHQRGIWRLKTLPLDTSSPPFLCPPFYPPTVEETTSLHPYTSHFFGVDHESPLPPTKVEDDMGFHYYQNLSVVHVRSRC